MKRILALLSLCLLAPCVFAAPNFFTPSVNDQSMYFLGTIFGEVGNVLTGWGSSTLLMYTFYYFNQAVLVLGCIVIVYTLIVSTVNTSHHGEMMGSKWNSVWIPMRTAIGFALLLPIGTGKTYAVVQAIVMWVIVQGVGAADYLWSNMVDQIVSGGAAIQADTASSTSASDTVMSAFQYYVCAIEFVQAQGMKKYSTASPSNGPYSTINNNTNYKNTVPQVMFSTSTSNAVQPNTNFWTFGVVNPGGWQTQSICGTISTPMATDAMVKSGDPKQNALATYYNNQRNIMARMLGLTNTPLGTPTSPTSTSLTNTGSTTSFPLYLPNSQIYDENHNIIGGEPVVGTAVISTSNSYSQNYGWGIYGGNWLGDDGANNNSGKGPKVTIDTRCSANWKGLNGCKQGLKTMQLQSDGTTYQLIYLPTVGYLAELMAEYIDSGSPSSDPTGAASTESTSGSGTTDTDTTQVLATSQIPDYVEQQLALVAQAYTDATAANYKSYQDAIANIEANPAQPTAGAPATPGSLGTTADLAAAAKFNGWASAGALYLDMSKVLQATSSDIAATNDFSYGTLACSSGIGLSPEANNQAMLCKDARSPPDVGGQRGSNSSNVKKKKNWGTDLGDAITTAQSTTNQALGLMTNNDDTGSGDPTDGTCDQAQKTDANGNPIYNGAYGGYGHYDGYTQKCGIYNSTGSGAFSTANFPKPKVPKLIIMPTIFYNYVNAMMMYNFSRTLTPMMNMGQSAVMANPIMTLRRSGIILLNTSSRLYHWGLRYMWFSGAISYIASAWNPLYGAAASTFSWAASMSTAMIGAMMAMGAIMAYYFPMIPYLVFTFATIQWLILTIEAMAAAPLMALGILHPEGQHEVFGHSSMGIAILSTVFLRPSLMIVGYFAATIMCYVVILLINAGFFFAAGSMMSGDSSTGSVFGAVIVWVMYLNMVMVAINKAFSLIYHIPDHVTRWIGINETGGGVEEMMGKVQEGAKQGGDLGKAGMDSGAKAQGSTANQATQKREKKEGGGKKDE